MALLVAVIPQLILPLFRKLFRTSEEVRLANEAAALHQRMVQLGFDNGWSMEDLTRIRLPTLNPPSALQTVFVWTLISFQLGVRVSLCLVPVSARAKTFSQVYFIVLLALIQQMLRVYVWQTSTARRVRPRQKVKSEETKKKR